MPLFSNSHESLIKRYRETLIYSSPGPQVLSQIHGAEIPPEKGRVVGGQATAVRLKAPGQIILMINSITTDQYLFIPSVYRTTLVTPESSKIPISIFILHILLHLHKNTACVTS